MGRKQTKGGVETRDTSIRVSFVYRGETCRETFRLNGAVLPPTAANVRYVQKQMDTLRQRVALGTFDYNDFFPHSSRATAPAVQTFGGIADMWLRSKGQLEAATLDQYGTAVRMWKAMLGTDLDIDQITYQHLASKIGGKEWPSPKSLNNYLVALRGIMGFHYAGPRAGQNPMIGIENGKAIKKLPDPLTADERDLILADMRQRYDPRAAAYFAFAFYTGMRPEEIIALQWGDVDWRTGVIRVARVRTFKGDVREGSKTGDGRDVDLMHPALDALQEMKRYTFMKNGDIFESPVTDKPWHDERSQRDTFWKPTLRRLGIRQRRAYCTRHTFATVALMGGVNAAYVAKQMGHSSTKMFFETYARWIDGADKGFMRAAMAEAFGAISPQSPQPAVNSANSLISLPNIGRRDWTRTKTSGTGG